MADGFMVAIAVTLAGSTFIPLLWAKNPKNFPADTLKAHFNRFILNLKSMHLLNTFLNTLTLSSRFLYFYHDIVHVILLFTMHHAVEYGGHSALIICTCVFQPERHHHIVEIFYGRSEGRHFCISWRHLYLIIATEFVHEGLHGISCSRIY